MSIGIKRTAPEEVIREAKMADYDLGSMGPFNKWSEALARESLKEIVPKYGLDVVTTFVKSSGWFDGVRELHAIVRRADDVLLEIVWHGGMYGGSWMRDTGHGKVALYEEDIAVPVTYMVVGLGPVETYSSEESLTEALAKRGIKLSSRSNDSKNVHSLLWDKPVFDKLCGPMKDGDRVRYETWETYEALSR